MTTNPELYLTTLHKMLDRYFDLEEIRTLCFQLNVDYDSVRGEGKSARIRHLILDLARHGRLEQLVAMASLERPHVTWPPVPDDLDLPSALSSSDPPPTQITQHHYYGDVVQGDKVGGDKVGGDKITVGNISNSQGVAIGSGASAVVNSGDTFNLSGDFQGSNLNIKSTLQQVAQTVGASAAVDQATTTTLGRLLTQLNGRLQAAPADQLPQAEELAASTQLFVETATADNPNPTMLRMLSLALQQTAQGLETSLPGVTELVQQIVAAVTSLKSTQ